MIVNRMENRMIVDEEWSEYKNSKDESYYDDMPDYLEGDEIDE